MVWKTAHSCGQNHNTNKLCCITNALPNTMKYETTPLQVL